MVPLLMKLLTVLPLFKLQIFCESRSIEVKGCKPNNYSAVFAVEVNVKTVLFKETDILRQCFTLDKLQLLLARRVMQSLVPKKIPKDFPGLLNYVKKAEVILEAKAAEDKERLVLKRAMYDALGGYLFAVAIPVLNEAFYAGNVRYQVAAELHNILNRMMRFLRTNGGTWSNPCDMSTIPTKVTALPMKLCDESKSCDVFVLSEHITDTLNDVSPRNKSKCTTQKCNKGIPRIQIPFLDDNFYPSALVLPFKRHALHSLLSPCSVDIIPMYYIQAMKCLSNPQYSNDEVYYFNRALHKWIIATVVPHLNELSRWYPGFGGVMRVVETMNQRGLACTSLIHENIRPYNVCVTDIGTDGLLIRVVNQMTIYSRYRLFWIVITLLAILLLLCIVCTMIRRRRCNCADDGGVDSSYSNTSGGDGTTMKSST